MTKGPRNPERSFGVSVGIVLSVVSALLFWRGRPVRGEVLGAIGAVLLVCGLVYPPILARPSALWWRFSRALGAVNARVLLTLLFCLVFVPLSVVWRVIGRDPLGRRRDRWAGWSAHPSRYRDPKHYLRMY